MTGWQKNAGAATRPLLRSCLRLTAGAGLLNRCVANGRSRCRIVTDDARLVAKEVARAGRSRNRIGVGRELRVGCTNRDGEGVAGLGAAAEHAVNQALSLQRTEVSGVGGVVADGGQ